MKIPLAIVNFKSTGDAVGNITYCSNPKKVTAKFDGLETGIAVGTPREIAELLLAYHHDKRAKRLCRTGIISVQTPVNATPDELADIDQRLLQAARDLQLFLKIGSMLGWVHGNTATRHLHFIFPNSNGRRTLDLRPKMLRQIQSFCWTAQLLTGRGRGRRKSLSVYPKTKLIIRDLAEMLVTPAGGLNKPAWDELVRSRKISDFRTRNDGTIISFAYQNRRFRVNTLKQFALEYIYENSQNNINKSATAADNTTAQPVQTGEADDAGSCELTVLSPPQITTGCVPADAQGGSNSGLANSNPAPQSSGGVVAGIGNRGTENGFTTPISAETSCSSSPKTHPATTAPTQKFARFLSGINGF